MNAMGKDAPAGSWQFQEMIPGMHITSGPGVTLFLGSIEATGRFMVDADLLLFPNSTTNGYGVMVGGRTGAGGDSTLHAWSALVLSGSGQFAVVRHRAGKLEQLVPWTVSDAIIRRDSVVITNRVRVWAEGDSVRFVVNGKPIGALPRASVEPDGLFGLRLDEGINIHVTNVDLTRRLLKR